MNVFSVCRKISRHLQQYKPFFLFAIFLREKGIWEWFNWIVIYRKEDKVLLSKRGKKTSSYTFFDDNKDRVETIKSWLSDDKSREVYNAAIKYRALNEPIPHNLYKVSDQYFVKGIIKLKENEVFVDGGAYTGDTIQFFINECRRNKVHYKKIVAFEPGDDLSATIHKFNRDNKKLCLIKKGLSDQEGVAYFKNDMASSKISESADNDGSLCSIQTVNIDSIKDCSDVTYIKMDIEGSETKALLGAKQTILKNHPKLAICIYHSDEDMIRIPEMIHEMDPSYKLYIRHHSRYETETVLYAV